MTLIFTVDSLLVYSYHDRCKIPGNGRGFMQVGNEHIADVIMSSPTCIKPNVVCSFVTIRLL